jgi:hypothetical protein
MPRAVLSRNATGFASSEFFDQLDLAAFELRGSRLPEPIRVGAVGVSDRAVVGVNPYLLLVPRNDCFLPFPEKPIPRKAITRRSDS